MNNHQHLIFNAEIKKETHDVFISWVTTKLTQGMNELTVNMSSTGGNVAYGLAIMNFVRALPIQVNMHNTGSIGSIAIPIYCSAQKRSASPLSTFTFHGAGQTTTNRLDEKTLRELLETTSENNRMIAKAICEKSNLEEDAAHDLLRGEITKSPEWAMDNGICDDILDFKIPDGGNNVTNLF